MQEDLQSQTFERACQLTMHQMWLQYSAKAPGVIVVGVAVHHRDRIMAALREQEYVVGSAGSLCMAIGWEPVQ